MMPGTLYQGNVMVHRPIKPLRMTSGPHAGKTYITTKNVDGSVTVKSAAKIVTNMTIPRCNRSKVTPGKGSLTVPAKITMINGNRST